MTVSEVMKYYKDKYLGMSRRPGKFHICPSVAINPRIGTDYTNEVGYSSSAPKLLADVEVTKHYVEGDTICIVYKNTEELQAQMFN